MQAPKKILIVGEANTGKSALIRAFLQHQEFILPSDLKANHYQLSNCIASTNNDTQNNFSNSENNKSMDFNSIAELNNLASEPQLLKENNAQLESLKETNLKMQRIQSDLILNQNRNKQFQQKTVSQVGSNTDFTLKIMKIEGSKVRVQLWDQGANVNPKSTFQPLYTRHVSGCIIVANTSNPDSIAKAAAWKQYFDKITKVKDEPSIPCTLFINHDIPISVSVSTFDVLKPDDADEKLAKKPRKESETFDEPSFLNKEDTDLKRLDTDPILSSFITSEKRQTSDLDPNSLQINNINTPINQKRILHFEEKADKEKHGYFGIYHVTTSQPGSVFESFENFISRMIEDEKYAKRSFTIASDFFDEYTTKNAKSESFNSQYEMDWSDEQVQDQQGSYLHRNNRNRKQRTASKYSDPYGSGSCEHSFKLKPLKDRRYERMSRDSNNNSCC